MNRHQPLILAAAAFFAAAAVAAPPVAGDTDEEIQKPVPFSKQEQQVLGSLQNLSTERLLELMKVYEKLSNEALLNVLTREILKRNPTNAEALRVSGMLTPEIEVRAVGYLDKLAAKLMSGQKVDDPEGIATQARLYIEGLRAEEAVRLLLKLRSVNYGKADFPFLDDLAVAYHDAGQLDESEKAWKQVLSNPTTPAITRRDAERGLATIALEKRIAGMRAKSMANPAKGVVLSSDLLEEMPSEPLAIAFYIECLNRAGQHGEVVSYLEKLKAKSPRKGFTYQDDLGDAYYMTKDFDAARAAFRAVLKDADASPLERQSAEKMLLSINITEKVEEGLKAILNKDLPRAQAILAELDAEYPNSEDVFGYRCLIMAKTGRSEEALQLLQEKRRLAADRKQLFMHLDTLGDVHLERKEFEQAKAAYEEILRTPGYDEQNRKEAFQGLVSVERDKLFHLANTALLNGKRTEAKEHADKLFATYPKDPEVLVLQADVKLAYGQIEEALDDYTALKDRYYANKYFPGQTGLATALRRVGKPAESLQAVEEIQVVSGYEADEVWNARWERRELLPLIRHNVGLDLNYVDAAEGREYRQALTYASPWLNEWRLVTKAEEVIIALDKSQTVFEDLDTARFEAQVSLQRRLKGHHFAEVTIGGTQHDVIYGARFGNDHPNLSWSIGFTGNARSTDSMALESLDGREDRVDFSVNGLVGSRVRYDFDAYVKKVKVGGDSLGEGYGASVGVDYVVQAETIRKPEITVGYYGQYTRFNSEGSLPSSVTSELREAEVRPALPASSELRKALPSNYGQEIFNTLVDPETHRHGIELTVRKHLNLQWNVFAQVGTYYELEQQSLEYTAAAGVEYWLSDSAMLYAEIRYDSAGRGVNAGQPIIEASLGAEISF